MSVSDRPDANPPPAEEVVSPADLDHLDEWAALYAIGALPNHQVTEFEERLKSDSQARALLSSYFPVVDALVRGLEPMPPPPSLAERLHARITASRANDNPPTEGGLLENVTYLLRAEDSDWKATSIPGVAARRLNIDRQTQRQTLLLRLEKGATIPAHPHHDSEECFVLQGDLWSNGIHMRAGDFQYFAAGDHHRDVRTENGCILYIRAPLDLSL